MPSSDPTDTGAADLLREVAAADLLADTTLTPDPEVAGRYHSEIPVAWQIRYAFGGVTMMTALRAAETALGRADLRPLTASALFCAPVPCGPVTTDTTLLRGGRTAAQVAADLRVPGTEGTALRLQANFAADHGDRYDFTDVRFPEGVAAPESYEPPPPPPDDAPFNVNYHDQTEWRFVSGNRPWDGDFEAGPARALSWHRLLREPRHADGRYEISALCVPGDILGSAVGQALGPRAGHFFVLSLEIAIRFVDAPVGPWVLQDARADHSSGGYATGTSMLWDTNERLVAIATQTAYLIGGVSGCGSWWPARRERRGTASMSCHSMACLSWSPSSLPGRVIGTRDLPRRGPNNEAPTVGPAPTATSDLEVIRCSVDGTGVRRITACASSTMGVLRSGDG